ncbi:hypothetical protein IQ254_20485 [Nodosilinea sp. LEGE 07088]|uniref:hypothetical protein n=1 Tax=Nodosilinea sp. LEGE 07088 TaxID=2777968 RepID=UPI001880F350|nr:hypothetical protein [Nodosilinea sp. LEGE 07088]MBE9139545.1 hypothetical protein [Nodosilinea sp. LEGE 07088]
MGLLADAIGNKVAGELIKSQDWNQLVAALETVEASLTERVDSLETTLTGQITTLGEQITGLRTDVDALEAVVNPLLQQYYRLNLSTARVSYALGQLAEITVQLTDLQGNIPTFTAQNRPWVDLVSTWGQFKPVSGFASRGGVGDRTLSVQVNTSGLAQVQLRSDYAEGLADEDEDEMAVVLQSRPQGMTTTVAEAILNATTPLEARPTYQLLRSEYERSSRVQTYLDTHYIRHPAIAVGTLLPRLGSRWREYRATVMAFVKPDSDPTTADASLGVSSLQVTFRDWIGPWIVDYINPPVVELPVDLYRDRLRPRITPRYAESTELLKTEVADIVRDKGLLGKQRDYRVLNEALNQLNPEVAPPFLNVLTESMRDAIGIQQALGASQTKAIGITTQEVGFKVFSDAALRADTNTAAAQETLAANLQTQVNQSLDQARQTLQQEQQAFRASIESENGVVQRAIRQQISPLQDQVSVLRNLDPAVVNRQLQDVAALRTQVEAILPNLRLPR